MTKNHDRMLYGHDDRMTCVWCGWMNEWYTPPPPPKTALPRASGWSSASWSAGLGAPPLCRGWWWWCSKQVEKQQGSSWKYCYILFSQSKFVETGVVVLSSRGQQGSAARTSAPTFVLLNLSPRLGWALGYIYITYIIIIHTLSHFGFQYVCIYMIHFGLHTYVSHNIIIIYIYIYIFIYFYK